MDFDNPREGYCKQSVYAASGNWGHSYQCSRKTKLDGYCKQHHPDTVAARDVATKARWADERKAAKDSHIAEERFERERILRPILDDLKELAAEYAVSQPCRNPVDIVDAIIELVREGLEVPIDS